MTLGKLSHEELVALTEETLHVLAGTAADRDNEDRQSFSAFDVTQKMRADNPDIFVPHNDFTDDRGFRRDGVRTIVHVLMAPRLFENDDDTGDYGISDNGTFQTFVPYTQEDIDALLEEEDEDDDVTGVAVAPSQPSGVSKLLDDLLAKISGN